LLNHKKKQQYLEINSALDSGSKASSNYELVGTIRVCWSISHKTTTKHKQVCWAYGLHQLSWFFLCVLEFVDNAYLTPLSRVSDTVLASQVSDTELPCKQKDHFW